MKKALLICGVLLLLVVGCGNNEEDTTVSHNYTYSVTSTDDCVAEAREYYQEDDRSIYGVCVNDIIVTDENGTQTSLRDLYNNEEQKFTESIIDMTSSLSLVSTLDDGGTKIYKNDDLTVIECNTTEGNKDVYIGNKDLTYHEIFCQ